MFDSSYSLCKKERLCGKKVISDLFSEGYTFFQAPYKVFWRKIVPSDGNYPSRFAVSVPKRRFKRAVKRNLMKRRIREAYRLNKSILNSSVPVDYQIHLIVIYASDHLLPLSKLDASMKLLLQRLAGYHAESC